MSAAPTFEVYLSTLGRLTGHVDPTASTPEAEDIKEAAHDLAALSTIDVPSLATPIGGE
jgi:type IV secretory pathway ATPase VirB11/archaellum biosynthesis ATPase